MIIYGIYDRVKGYFIILARINVDNKWYNVNFMFDTSASVTALLDRDAIRIFGGKFHKLKKARKDLVGIGEFTDTYVVRNVELELVDAYNPEIKYRITLERLYVVTHLPTTKHNRKRHTIQSKENNYRSRKTAATTTNSILDNKSKILSYS